MSNSINRGIKYVSLGLFVVLLLALVVLLLALLYTSYNSSTSLQPITATMEAVAAKAESARAAAQTIEAKLETLGAQAEGVETPVAGIEIAVTAAETAVAAAQTAVASAPPTTTPTELMIPLDVGVGITYQAADGPGMIPFSVDNLKVYRSYADFEANWPLDGPATVRLALIETQESAGEWQLFHTELPVGTGATPTDWSEYALLVELHPTRTEELIFEEGLKQKIVTPELFIVEPDSTTGDSLDTLEDAGAELDLSSKLLLADDSTGVPNYILIIFDPASGAGGDQCKAHCSACQGVSCWICWLCG